MKRIVIGVVIGFIVMTVLNSCMPTIGVMGNAPSDIASPMLPSIGAIPHDDTLIVMILGGWLLHFMGDSLGLPDLNEPPMRWPFRWRHLLIGCSVFAVVWPFIR